MRTNLEKLATGIIGALIATAAAPDAALACSVCFGDPSAPETKAMKLGIFVLLGFIGSVLAGFGGLFMYWMSRSRRLAQMDEGATQ